MDNNRSKIESLLIKQLDEGAAALSVAPYVQSSMMAGVYELSQQLNAYLKDDDNARPARVEHIRQALKKPGTMEVLDYLYKLNRCRAFDLNKAWSIDKVPFAGVEKNDGEDVLVIVTIYSFLNRDNKILLTLREVHSAANLDFTLR